MLAQTRTEFLALECLPILIRAAKEGNTISYAKLGKEISHPAHLLDQILAFIRTEICFKRGWPPLSVLVLDGCTGLALSEPQGELSHEDYAGLIARLQQSVFTFNGWNETSKS